MNNRKNNFLIAVKTFVAVVVIGFSIGKAQGVFITEIADPHNVATGGRFVELYNNTESDVDNNNLKIIVIIPFFNLIKRYF